MKLRQVLSSLRIPRSSDISNAFARKRRSNRRQDHPLGRFYSVEFARFTEELEDRTLLSTITVTTLADNTTTDGQVTLREAIQAANTDTSVDGSTAGSGADEIVFNVGPAGGTITLTSSGFSLDADVTITGLGADQLTIDANTLGNIFSIGSSSTVVFISGLTITNGKVAGAAGAIWNDGTLTLTDSTISNSEAGTAGGAIHNGGTLTVTGSTLSGNRADLGGGIYNNNGTVTVTNSTISGNSAKLHGGGIWTNNTTTFNHTTITDNLADSDDDSSGTGGGVYVSTGTTTTHNSIISGNHERTSGADVDDDIVGSLSGSSTYNLIGVGGGLTNGVDGNQVGVVDPKLAALGWYGGTTQTHALLSDSTAIDAADPSSSATRDQRSVPRPLDGGTSEISDIGAFEFLIEILVDENSDTNDGDYSAGNLSLREAVDASNTNPGTQMIYFAQSLAGQTITLAGTHLELTDDVTITGLGADQLILDGNAQSRIFQVDYGVTANISGLTITNGNVTGDGGGIFSRGTLTLSNSTVSNSYASRFGGGIANEFGTLTVTGSTISGNMSGSTGGGINNIFGSLSVTNSTISGNSAGRSGGGICADGEATTTLNHVTITDNLADSDDDGTSSGGGIHSSGGSLSTAYNSIISGNHEKTSGANVDNDIVQYAGTFTGSYNLIGAQTGTGLTNGVDGNQVGVVDPKLAALGWYGGTTQTHALMSDSTAIDQADPSSPATEDQRGIPRPLNGGSFETSDIGAFEYLTEILVDENSDVVDNNYSTGHVSLREAINASNTNPGTQIISFDGSLGDQTITLGGTQLALTDDVTITGLGAHSSIIDGNAQSRIFQVNNGVTANISGLTITNGNVTGDGGGIFSRGTLTLSNSTVSNSYASRFGGGIANEFGTLTVTGSTISGNMSGSTGGGINNIFGTLSVTNSTISGNSAGRSGGGICADGEATTTLNHVTITDNLADSDDDGTSSGGGIHSSGGSLSTAYNSIISGNHEKTSGANVDNDIVQYAGTFTGSYNLIGAQTGTGLTNGVDGNQVGVVDPKLAALGWYGGTTQTHALMSDSTAIDQADPSSPATEDQRGIPRPLNGGSFETSDIGAFEYLTEILVDENSDVVDNNYSTGHVSLREAINASNTNPGTQIISFDGSLGDQTITLGGTQLALTDDVTITGLGAHSSIIDGNAQSRIFQVNNGVTANISGLTITNGSSDTGGGIYNLGTLTLSNSTVSNSYASGDGGGIQNILNEEGNPTLTVTGSTISGNMSGSIGGGINNFFGSLSVTNSTISGNSAGHSGGGIFTDGETTLNHVTITDNLADSDDNSNSTGGGIVGGTTTTVHNSIISGNHEMTAGVPTDDDVAGHLPLAVGSSYNLIGVGGGLTNGVDGNQVGVVDPKLAALGWYGGPTQTHALMSDSTAIDAADPASALTEDQRGVPRPLDGGTSETSDIGAFEFLTNILVDNNGDEDDGNYSAGNVTLREAINASNTNPGTQTIMFDDVLSGQTITLGGTQLQLTDDVTIANLGTSSVTIDGNMTSRIFYVNGGVTAYIIGLTISNGNVTANGGGILNFGTLTIDHSTISGNTAGEYDGGISNWSGTLTVTNSTISGNTATNYSGGGIGNFSGTLTVTNSTISGNQAAHSGGGIYTNNNTLLNHVTITDNLADSNDDGTGSGGGIYISAGSPVVFSSIISGNHEKTGGVNVDDDVGGSLAGSSTYNVYNLIGVGGGLSDGVDGNQVGVVDPKLMPLGWYGGTTQTHALMSDSTAIDAASPGSVEWEDQRGAYRPQNGGVSDTNDIGAFEFREIEVNLSFPNVTLSVYEGGWFFANDDDMDGLSIEFDEFALLTINGTSGADRLTVDFSGGEVIPGLLTFNGGDPTSGTGDMLVLTGGSFGTVTYNFENASDGTIELDGSTITFTGLEPITDNLSAVNRVFTFGDTADTITLGDDGVPSDSISRISSTSSSETVDFLQPTSSLTINAGGGDDSLVVVNVDINNGATVNINGEAGTDSTVVYGSTGDDFATLTETDLTFDRSDFTINGTGFEMYDLRANGGNDTAELYDSAGADTFVASPTTARMVGTGFANWVRDFDKVTGFSNNGGSDTAYLHDSAGDDTYVASPTAARLTGTGFYNVANGFDVVRGYALNGGTDEAHLHDSAGDDTFIASATLTRLIGSGFSNWAQSFEKVTAYALNGGTDTGELYDSPGDDDYISSATVGRVIGPGFANWVRNFERVYVRSLNGGTDEAYLYDSAGDDTYIASATVGRMTGTGFYNAALYFDRVNAYRVNGGADEAQLYDSPGDDTFIASATVARLINSSSSYWAYYFPEVYARAINGGNDVADLYDSAGVDTFTVSPFTGRMEGTGFYNWVSGFDEIRGFSINGGNDNANLHDSSGNDTFVASPTTARMEGTGFINRATGFRFLNGFALNGGTDTAYLHDSAGDDFFTSSPGVSRMYGVGFSNFARNFEAVNAFALQGGNDLATYSEIQMGDSVTGSGDEFTLGRSGELDKANSFDTVRVEAGDGQTPNDGTGVTNYLFEKVGTWL